LIVEVHKKCIVCGVKLKGKQRKYCCGAHQTLHRKAQRKKRRAEKKCIVCGHPLKGKQRTYCSKTCLTQKRRDIKYYKKRYEKKWLEQKKVCIVCGKLLPKFKQKYCSYTCERAKKNLWNTLMYEADKVLPQNPILYCDECNGRVVMMPDKEYVCMGCGLVY